MRACGQPLSETSYPERRPLIVFWGARALYIGPAMGLSPHRNAVAVLAIGIDAPFSVAINPLDPNHGYKSCQSALIHPNKLHHLRLGGPMAFLYLDVLSLDYAVVRQQLKQPGVSVSFELRDEAAIVECLANLRHGTKPWRETRPTLAQLLGLQETQQIDPRIAASISILRHEPSRDIDAAELARTAELSVSRFLHVFKATTGVPFRRYRTWCRLGSVVRAAVDGTSLTGAAHAAGLASSAHLSAAFRQMFGVAPSNLKLQHVQFIEGDEISI